MATALKAPPGKTRVVRARLFCHDYDLIGDYDTCEEAYRVADEYNKSHCDPMVMNDVYLIFDDEGRVIVP